MSAEEFSANNPSFLAGTWATTDWFGRADFYFSLGNLNLLGPEVPSGTFLL